MPDLASSLHLDMLQAHRDRPGLLRRVWRAVRRELRTPELYGLHWGDPETIEPLAYVRDHFLLPYLGPEVTALEIGPGGGRWTRYLLRTKRLYVVDYHAELLEELRRNFRQPHLDFVHNAGTDFPGVPAGSVDFIFSFGTFVHLDLDLIESYLHNMRAILAPQANVVLQYADVTKPLGAANPGFSQNTPARMRDMVTAAGYRIVEEDVATLWHSAVVRFSP